ncbi:MAG: hypothetical protein LUH11_00705 [Candidatus Gastranaerophilales bacterium]|nr:hypothetical protein [Candidatus Gastranaerophilales bacterium]
MSNINPIKFGVAGQYYKNNTKEDLNNSKDKEQQISQTQQKQVSSNDVLGYLAAQNTDMIPIKSQKTLDVSKYVSEDDEARITEFMKGFESDYNEAYAIAADEFPEISENAAGNLALAYINASYSE